MLLGDITKKLGLLCGAMTMVIAGGMSAHADDQVNVRFSWKLKGEYAPLYVAQDKGYFTQNKLSVRLGEGAGAPAALGALLQGQEDAVVLPGIFAVSAIQKGMPIKLIAVYHPKTPVVIISHPDKPIKTPKDIEGKSIAVSVGETGTTYLSTFAAQNGVDFSKIKRVQVDAQSRVAYFLQKQVDLVTVYRSNDLPALEEKVGTNFPMVDMAQYGLVIPGLAIVSSDAIIAKKGDALKRFLAAIDKGITYTKGDVKGASEILLKSWPAGPSLKVVEGQVKATIDAMEKSAGHPVGWTDDKLIEATLTLLKSDENIGTPKPTKTFFTNDLLPKQ
ncbi:MAG: ABC transporter substrate-binding protein [Pseudolabrys sp.]|nr:ABC transporter substrate-binding protein [Pseudolabrys sp.]MCW5684426.1 ABC transporter substrate-binding protein [Pseudolabrys sp.]